MKKQKGKIGKIIILATAVLALMAAGCIYYCLLNTEQKLLEDYKKMLSTIEKNNYDLSSYQKTLLTDMISKTSSAISNIKSGYIVRTLDTIKILSATMYGLRMWQNCISIHKKKRDISIQNCRDIFQSIWEDVFMKESM